jgi:hypothetical protein
MYDDAKVLGRFFTAAPSRVGFSIFLLSFIVLLLPAWGLNILFITDERGHGASVGCLQSLNWSLIYPIVLPLIFANAAILSQECTRRMERLADPQGMNVIRHDDGGPADDFMKAFSEGIRRWNRALFWSCLTLTCVLLVADTWGLIHSIASALQHRDMPPSRFIRSDWDWTISFAMDSQHFRMAGAGRHPGIILNSLFDLVAYAMEGAAIFLGLYFVGKVWITLRVFAHLIVDPRSGFTFFPWWEDRSHRMGLRGVGYLFNRFLGITIAFQAYILYLRLQLISRHSYPFWDYVSRIADQTKHLIELQNFWALRAFDSIST